MDSTQDDAQLLWNDVLTLLTQRNMPPAALAMLRSCEVLSLDDSTLRIATGLGFAQRKIRQQSPIIEECLAEAAFQPLSLDVELAAPTQARPIQTSSQMSSAEAQHIAEAQALPEPTKGPAPVTSKSQVVQTVSPGFADTATDLADSRLTFDRFVAGEENMLAFEAAKQVANGENKGYNPLFIYGKSGLGKTHLLRAIQNYVVTNDSSRLCVYRTAAEFVEDYRIAWNKSETSARLALSTNYQNVDILIIDDVQNMRSAAGSIRFFFETFNALMARGKQIVLAADRSPSQLGMGESKFDERDTSRMDSGVTVSIQVPDYELKLNLINTFYDRMRQDAREDHIAGMTGTISEEMRQLMAERSGTNIRVIEGFVQTCIMKASQKEQRGQELGREDIIREANAKWPSGQRTVTVEQIQKAVEGYYDVSHSDLVGSKRNKELMEPRHVGIWLTRELTDNTLADIGKKFGGRSHATVKHSIYWVDKAMKENRIFLDHIEALKDSIIDKN